MFLAAFILILTHIFSLYLGIRIGHGSIQNRLERIRERQAADLARYSVVTKELK